MIVVLGPWADSEDKALSFFGFEVGYFNDERLGINKFMRLNTVDEAMELIIKQWRIFFLHYPHNYIFDFGSFSLTGGDDFMCFDIWLGIGDCSLGWLLFLLLWAIRGLIGLFILDHEPFELSKC